MERSKNNVGEKNKGKENCRVGALACHHKDKGFKNNDGNNGSKNKGGKNKGGKNHGSKDQVANERQMIFSRLPGFT
jgi:hypothetical protein